MFQLIRSAAGLLTVRCRQCHQSETGNTNTAATFKRTHQCPRRTRQEAA